MTLIAEEAERRDAHASTDDLDERQPVQVRVSPNLTSIHRILVEGQSIEWVAVEHCAGERDAKVWMVTRRWIVERLWRDGQFGATEQLRFLPVDERVWRRAFVSGLLRRRGEDEQRVRPFARLL